MSGDYENEAMFHLGNILYYFACLDNDDRCVAFDDAMDFYNKHNPDKKIEPEEGFNIKLVHSLTPVTEYIIDRQVNQFAELNTAIKWAEDQGWIFSKRVKPRGFNPESVELYQEKDVVRDEYGL